MRRTLIGFGILVLVAAGGYTVWASNRINSMACSPSANSAAGAVCEDPSKARSTATQTGRPSGRFDVAMAGGSRDHAMRIDVLYLAGCVNHGPAVDLVREVARDLDLQVAVHEIEVPDMEAATRLGFLGSPTIRVDGRDIEPDAENRTDYAMSCRVYGHSGVPPRVLIERALRSRAAQ